MLNFSLRERVNPLAPLDPRKYYAFIQSQGTITLRKLAKRISRESTISMMDTMAVLEGFLQVIPDLLLDGKIVKLNDFGTFRVTISSSGADTAEDFTASMIKGLNLKFRPGVEFRDMLQLAKYQSISNE